MKYQRKKCQWRQNPVWNDNLFLWILAKRRRLYVWILAIVVALYVWILAIVVALYVWILAFLAVNTLEIKQKRLSLHLRNKRYENGTAEIL